MISNYKLENNSLKFDIINTPLGDMIAIGDANSIYLLEFTDLHNLERELEIVKLQTKSEITPSKTVSYIDIATKISKPTAFRAVANANASNKLAIIIPCHRVIYANGKIGGYAGGTKRKEWLINHEYYF